MIEKLVLIKSRSGLDDRYTSAVARIRVYESRLLSRAFFERMIDADNLDHALKILSEDPAYRADIDSLGSKYDFERLFSLQLNRMYETLTGLVRDSQLLKTYFLKYDIENLKLMSSAADSHIGAEPKLYDVGVFGPNILRKCKEEGNYERLGPGFNKLMEEASETIDPEKRHYLFDSFYLSILGNEFKADGSPFLDFVFRTLVDLHNIKILFRLSGGKYEYRTPRKQYFLKGGFHSRDFFAVLVDAGEGELIQKMQNTDYNDLVQDIFAAKRKGIMPEGTDIIIHNFLMSVVKEAKSFHFGIEPVIGYALAKDMEIIHLRGILQCKKLNFTKEVFRKDIIQYCLESVYV